MNQEIFFKEYTSSNKEKSIKVLLHNSEVWLDQKNMSQLFDVKVNTINYHIKRLGIKEKSTIREFGIIQNEGGRKVERKVIFYNFDTLMAVGFRVNSVEAIRFCDWVIDTSKRYLVKNFVEEDDKKHETVLKVEQGLSLEKNKPVSFFYFLLKKVKASLSFLYKN